MFFFSILPATELVPGDIVEVSVGCKIPTDMKMIELLSNEVRVGQTGESNILPKQQQTMSNCYKIKDTPVETKPAIDLKPPAKLS